MRPITGDKVIVCYDPRPLFPYKEREGKVVKITPTGLIRIKTDDGVYNELFDPYTRHAKGWNTLWFKEAT
jgi:hypothetical protein